jgi:DNA repair exonuclease SbcCD nuclease subunit
MLDADEVCQGFDLVLAGDFHEPQEFGTCGRYVGSPMQHDFRDAGSGPRGVLFVEFAKNLVQRFIPIESPRFHVQKITRDSRALSNPLPRRGDYLRIDVEATHAEWLTSLPEIEQYAQELVAKGVNVLPPKHVPIAQVETRLGKNAPDFLEAASAYVKLANTEGLDPDRLIQIAQEVLNEVENG